MAISVPAILPQTFHKLGICIQYIPRGLRVIVTRGDVAQEVRAVVWQSEVCRFDPTLGVS